MWDQVAINRSRFRVESSGYNLLEEKNERLLNEWMNESLTELFVDQPATPGLIITLNCIALLLSALLVIKVYKTSIKYGVVDCTTITPS